MGFQEIFAKIRQTKIESPGDIYSFFEYMTSSNPPEVRRSALFTLSTELMRVKKQDPELYDILFRICIYELTRGRAKGDTWFERNLVEALVSCIPAEYLKVICEQVKNNLFSEFTIRKLNTIIQC